MVNGKAGDFFHTASFLLAKLIFLHHNTVFPGLQGRLPDRAGQDWFFLQLCQMFLLFSGVDGRI